MFTLNFCEKKATKKKKQKDVFQKLIEKMFIVCDEEMWKQRNLDRYKPKNKRNYAAIIQVDREIRHLYGLRDEVCTDDIATFYKTDLETQLAQPLHVKKRWITRWKPTIQSSRKRAKRDATRNTKAIWTFYRTSKPRTVIRAEHKRRQKQHKMELKRQRNTPLREITKGPGRFQIIGKKKSTSKQTKVTPAQPVMRVKFPSVTDYFSKKNNKREPANRFGDAGND